MERKCFSHPEKKVLWREETRLGDAHSREEQAQGPLYVGPWEVEKHERSAGMEATIEDRTVKMEEHQKFAPV